MSVPTNTTLLDRIGRRLRAARTERGISMRELASRSGVSERFVFQVEKGKANVSVSKLAALAQSVGLGAYELLQPPEPALPLRRFHQWATGADPTEVEEVCGQLLGEPSPRANIVALLGMRGAGKSAVGQRLALDTHARFVELDARVEERAEMPLSGIFSMHGPEYYEELERDCLLEVIEEDGGRTVLATGGGLVTHGATFDLLTDSATCVWLKAAPRTHWERVVEQGDQRPMAGNPRAYEQLCTILEQREPLYARADLTLETDPHDVAAVSDLIVSWLGPTGW